MIPIPLAVKIQVYLETVTSFREAVDLYFALQDHNQVDGIETAPMVTLAPMVPDYPPFLPAVLARERVRYDADQEENARQIEASAKGGAA